MHFLSHWGRVMHICISKLTSIWSDNGLSPDRHQAIIWTNAGILLTGRNSYIFIQENIFEYVIWKMAAMCLGLNVLLNDEKAIPCLIWPKLLWSNTTYFHWLKLWHLLTMVESRIRSFACKKFNQNTHRNLMYFLTTHNHADNTWLLSNYEYHYSALK